MESLLETTTFVLLHKLAVASRHAIGQRLAERPGLTLWQFATLAELEDHGPVAQKALGMDPSDMVRLMDELIAGRLVARDRDPLDRRRYQVTVTAAGRQALVVGRSGVRSVKSRQ